jgi:hypothetical protein
MMEFLGDKPSERKWRMLTLAGMRVCGRLSTYLVSEKGMALLEKLAEGDELTEPEVDAVVNATPSRRLMTALYSFMYRASAMSVGFWARILGHAGQYNVVHDLFGPLPFRPVAINPAWLAWNDGTVQKIAQAIYDERDFDRMPILADALEEAGCTNQDILDHCRSGGEHVRGCWVIDLVLGKS